MNWFKKLFSGGTTSSTGPCSPPPGAVIPPEPAPRIATRDADAATLLHVQRMEAEARRTGNPRLFSQAQRIRAKLRR